MAQKKTVTGIVTDVSGEYVIGASVMEVGLMSFKLSRCWPSTSIRGEPVPSRLVPPRNTMIVWVHSHKTSLTVQETFIGKMPIEQYRQMEIKILVPYGVQWFILMIWLSYWNKVGERWPIRFIAVKVTIKLLWVHSLVTVFIIASEQQFSICIISAKSKR